MATARKTAVIYVEVGADKKQVKLEDIQKASRLSKAPRMPTSTLPTPQCIVSMLTARPRRSSCKASFPVAR